MDVLQIGAWIILALFFVAVALRYAYETGYSEGHHIGYQSGTKDEPYKPPRKKSK